MNSRHDRKLIEQMNLYYDARAIWHDYYMNYISNEQMEQLLKPIVETVAPFVASKQVLEIACGTGNWTQALSKRAELVVAVDISSKALGIAGEKLSEYHNVILRHGDAYKLPDIGDTFEVLFASDWWSHIPKACIPQFLEGAAAKMGDGAKAIFLDMSFKDYFKNEPFYYDSDDNRVSIRKLPNGSPYEVIKNFPDENELRNTLTDFSDNIEYYEFDELDRWMVVFEFRKD
ncbi:MAG: methyltransferase domain-containing protein [candidate division Zixibacteria bacterium]|nr:methyltransferase domain-containing protein [candidate division Zixibacteria bacterium]